MPPESRRELTEEERRAEIDASTSAWVVNMTHEEARAYGKSMWEAGREFEAERVVPVSSEPTPFDDEGDLVLTAVPAREIVKGDRIMHTDLPRRVHDVKEYEAVIPGTANNGLSFDFGDGWYRFEDEQPVWRISPARPVVEASGDGLCACNAKCWRVGGEAACLYVGEDSWEAAMRAKAQVEASGEREELTKEAERRLGILRCVEQTLDENDVPKVDESGARLNANGRLVDFFAASTRVPDEAAPGPYDWKNEPWTEQMQRAAKAYGRTLYEAARGYGERLPEILEAADVVPRAASRVPSAPGEKILDLGGHDCWRVMHEAETDLRRREIATDAICEVDAVLDAVSGPPERLDMAYRVIRGLLYNDEDRDRPDIEAEATRFLSGSLLCSPDRRLQELAGAVEALNVDWGHLRTDCGDPKCMGGDCRYVQCIDRILDGVDRKASVVSSGPPESDERQAGPCAEKWRGETFTIACCPTHGLHGGRETCFECGVRCEQVPVRVVEGGES
jgi:hypothetical protein